MKTDIMIIENESKIFCVKKQNIMAITVDSKIVSFFLENGKIIYKTTTLKRALELLPEFVKINRSCAINIKQVKEICKKTRTIKLENNKTYKISARQMPKLHLFQNTLRSYQ